MFAPLLIVAIITLVIYWLTADIRLYWKNWLLAQKLDSQTLCLERASIGVHGRFCDPLRPDYLVYDKKTGQHFGRYVIEVDNYSCSEYKVRSSKTLLYGGYDRLRGPFNWLALH